MPRLRQIEANALPYPLRTSVYLTPPTFNLFEIEHNLGLNWLKAMPIYVPKTCTISRLAVDVANSTKLGPERIRIGLYTDNAGYPDALLAESGEIDISGAPNVYTYTLSPVLKLKRDIYWVAVVSNDAFCTVRRSSDNFPSFIDGVTAEHFGGVWVVHTYGALPNPFTLGGNIHEEIYGVGIWVTSWE